MRGSCATDETPIPYSPTLEDAYVPDSRGDRRDRAFARRRGLAVRLPGIVDLATKAGAGAATQQQPVPPFTAEHEQLRAEMREFVLTRLRPHAAEWERDGFPNEAFGWLAEAGYLGLRFPVAYGGGDDTVAASVWVEELARCGSGGVAAGLGAHSGIALPPIWTFGTDDQKQRYLVPGLRAELVAALAITEPDAGSDVAGIRTHASTSTAVTWSMAPRRSSRAACVPTCW